MVTNALVPMDTRGIAVKQVRSFAVYMAINCACPERFCGDCFEIGIVLIYVCIRTDEQKYCRVNCDGTEQE